MAEIGGNIDRDRDEEVHVPGAPEPDREGEGPPNVQVEVEAVEEQEYYVEKLLTSKMIDGVLKYRVKWLDCPSSQNTWEPLENLTNCEEVLEEFHRKEEARIQRRMIRDRKVGEGSGSGGAQTHTRQDSQASKTTPCSSSAGDHRRSENDTESETEADDGEPTQPVMQGPEGDQQRNETDTDVDDANDDLCIFIREALDPMIRQSWDGSEVPLAVIYSILFGGTLLYAVRLKPATEEETEAVRNDPTKGANRSNTVIVPVALVKNLFPHLAYEYEGVPQTVYLKYDDGSGSFVELNFAGVSERNGLVFVQEGSHHHPEGQGGGGGGQG